NRLSPTAAANAGASRAIWFLMPSSLLLAPRSRRRGAAALARKQVSTRVLGGLELRRVRGQAERDAAVARDLRVGVVGHPVRTHAGGVLERLLELLRLLLPTWREAVGEQLLARLFCALELRRGREASVIAVGREAVAAADGLRIGEVREPVL